MKRTLVVLVLSIPGLAFAASKLAASPPAAATCPLGCDHCPFGNLMKK